MDNAPHDELEQGDQEQGDQEQGDQDQWDLENGLEISHADEESKMNRRGKKRRKPMRKNRKPSRPSNYIGQRSNNHLLRIFSGE